MAKELLLTDLSTKEQTFIEALINNGGQVFKAAEEAGYNKTYATVLKKKLSKYIIEATQEHLALHAIKAADRVIASIDEEVPNNVRLNAANSLLDRVGLSKRELDTQPSIKANIFILPEKDKCTQEAKVLEHLSDIPGMKKLVNSNQSNQS